MESFRQRTAAVPGGAFGAAGASVVLGDVDTAALAAAVDELCAAGVPAHGAACDVRVPSDLVALRDAALEATGRVDVVCLNAGVAPTGRMLDTTLDTWHWVVDVNLFGVVHGIQAFGPGLAAQGSGHVVLTASGAGLMAAPFLGAYAATKHAVVGLAAVLRDELAEHGVGVTVACPGTIATDIFHSERHRTDGGAAASHTEPEVIDFYRATVDASPPPSVLADAVLQAVRDDRLFVLPSPELDEFVEARFAAIREGIAAR